MLWQRYRGVVIAAAGYLVAATLTRILWSSLFHHTPFALFFGAAAVAAWFGGFWLGFGVALLGAVTTGALLGDLNAAILASSLVMIGIAALISYLAEHSREIDSEREEARRLLETVLDQAPIGIALFDRELRYTRLNDALAGIDGVPVAAHLGRTAGEVLPRLGRDLEADLRRVLETGEPLSREISGETPAAPGQLRHWSIYAYALQLGGEIIGVGAVCEEVTAKKRAQEELRRAKEQAEAANEAKDHFLATLSHELRTPLTPVLATVAVLEEEARLPGYARQHLAMVRRNVELEARIIDDLLDLTRISRGKIELHPVPTDARPLVGDALRTSCQRDIESGRIHIESALTAASYRVCADAPRLSQVLWNLLNNAVKFTPDGGTVSIRTSNEDGQLTVSVADTGIGIEPARLAQIFEAFDQGDPAVTARFGGLGLGLAISRAIVEMHGGTLTAQSAGRGRGATFTVRLPLDPAVHAAGGDTTMAMAVSAAKDLPPGSKNTAPIPPVSMGYPPGSKDTAPIPPVSMDYPPGSKDTAPIPPVSMGYPPGSKDTAPIPPVSMDFTAASNAGGETGAEHLRILLIEDHGDTAAAMADLLGGLGHRVTVAGSVAAARAALRGLAVDGNRPPVDLVISDLGLPDGNGQDLMRELSRHYGLKGIALSGYGMEDDRDRSLRAGFSQHLTKPIHPRTLLQAIREVVTSG